jgi:hypothetical protein
MRFKGFLIFFVLCLFVVFIFLFSQTRQNNPKILGEADKTELESKPVKIATCPTFYNILSSKFQMNEYEVVKTSSTSESLSVLERQEVDYAIGGRILMPGEKEFDFRKIGNGFSFLSYKETVIFEDDLKENFFYTDLDPDFLKDIFGIVKIMKVRNVYDYLDKGIVITSWENTDYSLARIVHVINFDGSRNILSRIPIVYCLEPCEENFVEKMEKLLSI